MNESDNDDPRRNEGANAHEAADADAPTWMTKAQAANYIGMSARTVQRWIADGRLTSHGTGAGLRLRRAEIDAFMESRRSPEVQRSPRATLPREPPSLLAAHDVSPPSKAELTALGRQAHAAGIRRIFKSRALDAAYNAEFASALDAVESGEVKIMSNSLRFLLGPLPDRTLFIPMWEALRRGVRFKLLLLDPFSDAARTRSEVEERESFAGNDDERYYDTHLYRDIIAVVRTLSNPDIDFVRDEALRARIRSRTQVLVRFSGAEPTTHLVLTDDWCFVESYHTGGNPQIQDNLMRLGIPKLHCFGGFIVACKLTASCPSGELLASHFDHSWDAGGSSVEEVLERDRARQKPTRVRRRASE